MAFNFGQISNVISQYMDTDLIDIKRNVSGELQEIYSNIPCHIEILSTDNPDIASIDIKPIIHSINVHMNQFIDIQNDDYIVAKKMSNDNTILETYSGRCGNPVVDQARKKVNMVMSSSGGDTPTPPPPIEPTSITVNYLYDSLQIKDSETLSVEIGSSFTLQAPIIEGYNILNTIIDGVSQDLNYAYISEVENKEYSIQFVYDIVSISDNYRFLVNGLYTKDDGTLANGYHMYKKIPISNITYTDGTYTITSTDVKMIHEDNGKILEIVVGEKIVLFPDEIFVKITNIVNRVNGIVTFNAIPFTLTTEEANAYIAVWYD